MGIIDRLKELRATRNAIAQEKWTCNDVKPRAFRDDGGRTSEHTINEKLLCDAMNVVEHGRSSDITYCSSYSVGAAIQRCVLRYLDKEIDRLVREGEDELKAAAALLRAGAGGGA